MHTSFRPLALARGFYARAQIQAGRLPSVQILRALAALSVVVGHALSEARSFSPTGGYGASASIDRWTAGVDLFFVLSGFIMMWTFGHRFGEPGAWQEFLWRRLARIVPPYWIFTALMVLAILLCASRLQSAVFTPEHALLSFLFVPHIAPHGGIHPILLLGWTLMYEMFFYLSFTVALCLRRPLGLLALAAFFLLVHGLALHTALLPEALRLFWSDTVLFEFLFGVGFYFVQQDGELPPHRLSWVLLFCVGGSAAAYLAGQWWSNRLYHFGLPALALFAVFYYLLPTVKTPAWLLAVLVGEASYTLYLSHPFVLELAKLPFEALPVTAGSKTALYLVTAILAATLFSLAFYSLIERRLTQRLGRWTPRRAPIVRHLTMVTRCARRLACKARLVLRPARGASVAHRVTSGRMVHAPGRASATAPPEPSVSNAGDLPMLIDEDDLASLPPEVRVGIDEERKRLEAVQGGRRERHVLIIGGAGYVGGAVTRHLLAQGARVRNLDCLVYHHGAAILGFLGHPRYELVAGDMGDRGTVERALDGVTDVLVLAGLVGDPITKAFPAAAGRINDDAVRTCIDAIDGKGVNKMVFVSTCSNYGIIGEDETATEDFPLKPLSLYAKAKVAAERHILSREGLVDYSPTILRFATAFGLAPRTRFDLTVNEFTREIFLGNELLVYDAHTWRPYCHVRDFARLIARVLDFPVADVRFQVFNAGGDANNYTKRGIVDLVLERLPGRRVAYRDNSDDPRNYRVSFEKVRTHLHFTPRMSVGDGIDEIIWALSAHMLDDVSERRNYFGNYALPGLPARGQREDQARSGARLQDDRGAPAPQTAAGSGP